MRALIWTTMVHDADGKRPDFSDKLPDWTGWETLPNTPKLKHGDLMAIRVFGDKRQIKNAEQLLSAIRSAPGYENAVARRLDGSEWIDER